MVHWHTSKILRIFFLEEAIFISLPHKFSLATTVCFHFETAKVRYTDRETTVFFHFEGSCDRNRKGKGRKGALFTQK